MLRLPTLLIFLLATYGHSQQDDWIEVNLNATVLDYESNEAIPFAEVKFINKNIGTLSDSDGGFELNYFDRNVNDDDVFQLTANGYDTLITDASRLYKFLNNTNKFFLKKTNSEAQWFQDGLIDSNFIFGKIFSVKDLFRGLQ